MCSPLVIVPCDHYGAPVDERGKPLNPDKLKNDIERMKVEGVIRDNVWHSISLNPNIILLTTFSRIFVQY